MTKTTKRPQPLKVTSANITRVLTAAGFSKAKYEGLALYGGTSVCQGTDAETGEIILYAGHHAYPGMGKKPEQYEAEYAEALKQRFRVERRSIRRGMGSTQEVWAVFPLGTEEATDGHDD